MPVRGVSIALAMKLTALVALNLAICRTLPFIPESPPFLFVLVVLDIVLVQAVAFGRPLRAFHYTFLIVGVFSTGLVTAFAFRASRPVIGSLHILETLIQWSRAARGETRIVSPYNEFQTLEAAERFVTGAIGLLPAWVVGLMASRFTQRRGQLPAGRSHLGIMAFFQGALIGFGFFAVGLTLAYAFRSTPPVSHTVGWHIQRAAMVVCPLLGGLAALASTRFKSTTTLADVLKSTPAVIDKQLAESKGAHERLPERRL